ncbi:sigma-70 family RNA polymerase sigma factor [Bacillus sp. V2I10]|uniref:sigma-70 family RNA polymerase sigma factor n=1 Tax=Bacillus sp. V2I10 TaxID=3042276 RepID=UPI00277EB21C|nr:sigma-70 family RNA polymerase sigma factor [Bacillus sp. V2I10]MDQ0859946.1 RNA polymerase sigma-70 factor (ECF subfamily) [Bacillus sp. V2I10]
MEQKNKVKRAKNGDDLAFQELIELHKDKLYRIAYMYVKNESDTLDIVHETIYKAFISIKKLKSDDYFTTWITRILINCALDYIRKQKKLVFFDGRKETESEDNHFPVEDRIVLFDAIDQLEQKYKTIIILKYYKDLTLQQIAEVLDCPIGTAKVNLHRALKKLRIHLKEVQAK